jgi:hypothetical protein
VYRILKPLIIKRVLKESKRNTIMMKKRAILAYGNIIFCINQSAILRNVGNAGEVHSTTKTTTFVALSPIFVKTAIINSIFDINYFYDNAQYKSSPKKYSV